MCLGLHSEMLPPQVPLPHVSYKYAVLAYRQVCGSDEYVLTHLWYREVETSAFPRVLGPQHTNVSSVLSSDHDAPIWHDARMVLSEAGGCTSMLTLSGHRLSGPGDDEFLQELYQVRPPPSLSHEVSVGSRPFACP